MVALPFWLSTANAEFKANGWASNIRAQAGLPAAGFMSQAAGKTFVNLIENPRAFNFIPLEFWFDGTNTIIKHGGPYGSTAQYAIITGNPFIHITIEGAIALDNITAGQWQPMSQNRVVVRKAWSTGGKAHVTFANATSGATRTYSWTFTG